MRNIFFLIIMVHAAGAAFCQANPVSAFEKGKDGLEYRIYSSGNGARLANGHYMQLDVLQLYGKGVMDSLLFDSRAGEPVIEKLDSATTPAAYYEILKQLRNGDSVCVRILTDSAFREMPGRMPEAFKPGHYFTTSMKIRQVFTTEKQVDSAKAAAMIVAQKRDSLLAIERFEIEGAILAEYFRKNNIKATKAPGGTYISITNPGTGRYVTVRDKVKVNYSGKTIDGKVFDSNTDPAFGHMEPLEVDLSHERSVIRGWEEGLTYFSPGAKGVLYIPSPLGYGKRGSGSAIGPNEILIFDIEVLSVEPVVHKTEGKQ